MTTTTKPKTTYTTMTCSVGWRDAFALSACHDYCGVRHKTLAAAVRCDDEMKARVRRATGGNTWIDTRIVAMDGDNPRFLNEQECDKVFDLQCEKDAAAC